MERTKRLGKPGEVWISHDGRSAWSLKSDLWYCLIAFHIDDSILKHSKIGPKMTAGQGPMTEPPWLSHEIARSATEAEKLKLRKLFAKTPGRW